MHEHKIEEVFIYKEDIKLKCVESIESNKLGERRCSGCFFGYKPEYVYRAKPHDCRNIVKCCCFERKDDKYVKYIEIE
ncbi:MAG: hypothetical protein RSE41_09235 [Clostridia bacterium]